MVPGILYKPFVTSTRGALASKRDRRRVSTEGDTNAAGSSAATPSEETPDEALEDLMNLAKVAAKNEGYAEDDPAYASAVEAFMRLWHTRCQCAGARAAAGVALRSTAVPNANNPHPLWNERGDAQRIRASLQHPSRRYDRV